MASVTDPNRGKRPSVEVAIDIMKAARCAVVTRSEMARHLSIANVATHFDVLVEQGVLIETTVLRQGRPCTGYLLSRVWGGTA